ncbi:MAG: 3-isopropylmalate dehydratase small subunit [Vicinamibacterales bacterium]
MSIEKIIEIRGTGLPLRGDSIDTDRIIPARFLKSISFEGLEQHLFEDDRLQDGTHSVSNPAYAGSALLLVNANFGCGSSREHAPQAILRWGIRAVVGESFSEIFFGNSVAIGLACLTAAHDEMERLQAAVERDPSTVITVNLEAQTVSAGGVTAKATLPPAARESFLDGTWDATALLLDRFEEVEHVAERLPYVSGWR